MAVTQLLIGTRKGFWTLVADSTRRQWQLQGPQFLGHVISHVVQDPRDPQQMLLATRSGHLGPTVFYSGDGGQHWSESKQAPAFRKEPEGRVVDQVFWLSPGHASQAGSWYAGTSPQGLFVSHDGGVHWEGVAGFNEHPQRKAWCGEDKDQTPDGGKLHSILIDPRDAAHMLVSLSGGGSFESHDGGGSWQACNQGVRADFQPDPEAPYGHDPHCMRLHPARPGRLFQQNHCGLFRRDEGETRWRDIAPPAQADGTRLDIGFGLAMHAHDPDTLWTLPMDASDVWPRTSPKGQPLVMRSRDGGNTWTELRAGLPASQAWFTVKRQALCADSQRQAGVYFGTTSGEVWASLDEGDHWQCIAAHLPEIYSLETALLP